MTSDWLTLSEVAKTLPRSNGRRVHTSTLWRWCRRGCNGVRLEYYRAGRTIMVTQEMLQRFFAALAAADSVQATSQQPAPIKRNRRPRPKQREESMEQANSILRKAGILV